MDLEAAKADAGQFVLSGGYVKDGHLYNKAVLRGMTGVEEDVLVARRVPVQKRIDTIIKNCIVSLSGDDGVTLTDKAVIAEAVGNLTATDRIILLIAIRIVSLDSKYAFDVKCPECEATTHTAVDLTEFLKDVVLMPEPMKRVGYDVTLPSGKRVLWDVLTSNKEAEVGQRNRQLPEDAVSASLLARITTIDGQQATLDAVKALPLKDRNALRAEFERVEGSIETAIEDIICTNANCGAMFNSALDLGQVGFFFPERATKNHS